MSIARLHDVETREILAKVQLFVDQVKVMPEVTAIILFGSLASGQMTAASDIDLAILVDDRCQHKEMRRIISDIKRSCFTWPTDLLVMKKNWFESRKECGGICLEINASGKWLYTKDTGGGDP